MAGPRFNRKKLLAEVRESSLWVPDDVSVDVFGNTEAMAAELGALVRDGTKTATASLLWAWEWENAAPPKVDDREIVINWHGELLAVTETTEVEIVPFDQVDASFARDEGEGDGSLSYWKQVHWDFFQRECELIGREPSMDMPVVCQRFRKLYPSS